MKAWLYCISDEEHSCNELGNIRQEALRFTRERHMQVMGMTSINSCHSHNIGNMVASAVENKVDVIVISNVMLLKGLQKNHLHYLCKKNSISIVYAIWK